MSTLPSRIQKFFFFNDTATTEIYTLSYTTLFRSSTGSRDRPARSPAPRRSGGTRPRGARSRRSEEHTSELQSQSKLVCRLLLEKKKKKQNRLQTEKKKKKKTQ